MDGDSPLDARLCEIVATVLSGKMQLREAREKIRAWHSTLNPKEAKAFHKSRISIAQRLTLSAEGLAQEILVIGAGAPAEEQ
jgi:hypothetical protein